ncbi:MAG: hypothetical protein NT171_19405 [Planctomycetota bacterium]|nr:hypothetical protein [Planctomycetota bacterium]
MESGLRIRVNRAAVVTLSGVCFFLAIAVAQVAIASSETDREVTRVAQINGISESDAEFFAARIDAVEQSPNAVVTFETMSPWRKKRLLAAIEQWAQTFPKPEGRTQTTTRGHSWSIIGQIAQLYVIPPRLTPPEEAAAIDSQMAELREILVEELFSKVRSSISTAVQSSDAESSLLTAEDIDSLTATVIDNLLMGATLQKDDDLNPGPRWRISPSAFTEMKRRIREAAPATVVKHFLPFSESTVKSLFAARQAGDDSEAQRLFDSIGTDLTWSLRESIESVFAGPLEKAFADGCPGQVTTEYRKLKRTLEGMIDTAAAKAGIEEYLAIQQANDERWAAERQRDFAEVVARLPQNQVARAEQQSIAKGNSRGMIYLLVNVALVGLLAAVAWMRRRKRLAQESTP